MRDSPIRLLIAEDNLALCDILTEYFKLSPEISVCGVAHDGEEALFRIAQTRPDLVLLDLIMPRLDGLSVLERMGKAALSPRPGVIITSAVCQEGFTSAALSLGADYYMIKPYDLSDLLSRIRLVASTAQAQAEAPARSGADDVRIRRAVMELGIPTHMLAYRYCSCAVGLLLQDAHPHSIVKEIYTAVAEEFGTTPACVEGAIRKAVRQVWERNGQALRALMDVGAGAPPPSNGRFLTTLTERLRLPEGPGGGVEA